MIARLKPSPDLMSVVDVPHPGRKALPSLSMIADAEGVAAVGRLDDQVRRHHLLPAGRLAEGDLLAGMLEEGLDDVLTRPKKSCSIGISLS